MPLEITLEISPRARLDLVDVDKQIADTHGDVLEGFPRALYCSYHTTAGYLDQGIAGRLNRKEDGVAPYLSFFKKIFPEGAGYQHDELHLREELTEEQRMAAFAAKAKAKAAAKAAAKKAAEEPPSTRELASAV